MGRQCLSLSEQVQSLERSGEEIFTGGEIISHNSTGHLHQSCHLGSKLPSLTNI